jgi:hypothetical protein
VRVSGFIAIAAGFALVACAGRDPQPIATVQPQDQYADCAMISAEIQANNVKIKELADEQGIKTAQNVAAGVVGIVVWPVWFGMDFKGAAAKDLAALQSRQEYLTQLAVQRCAQPAPPPPTASPRAKPPKTQPSAAAPPSAADSGAARLS